MCWSGILKLPMRRISVWLTSLSSQWWLITDLSLSVPVCALCHPRTLTDWGLKLTRARRNGWILYQWAVYPLSIIWSATIWRVVTMWNLMPHGQEWSRINPVSLVPKLAFIESSINDCNKENQSSTSSIQQASEFGNVGKRQVRWDLIFSLFSMVPSQTLTSTE
jgi:hypothetical protein